MITVARRVPGGIPLMVRTLGLKPLRRLPIGLGALTKRPVPDEIVDRRLRPLRTDPAIRRDFRHYGAHVRRTEPLPRGRLVEIGDTRTLIAEDRPERLASLLRWFVAEERAQRRADGDRRAAGSGGDHEAVGGRPVRGDHPAVGEQLTGVVEDDRTVAEQAPALLGVGGHHVRGGGLGPPAGRLVGTHGAPPCRISVGRPEGVVMGQTVLPPRTHRNGPP